MAIKEILFGGSIGVSSGSPGLVPLIIGIAAIAYIINSPMGPKPGKNEAYYNELYNEFVKLADKDGNGYIDFTEQVDAWERAGYEGPFFESRGASQFPTPALEGLEKAVESYKQE